MCRRPVPVGLLEGTSPLSSKVGTSARAGTLRLRERRGGVTIRSDRAEVVDADLASPASGPVAPCTQRPERHPQTLGVHHVHAVLARRRHEIVGRRLRRATSY